MARFVPDAAIAAIRDWVKGRTPAWQESDYWLWRSYSDGTFEAHYLRSGMTFDVKYSSGNFYRSDPATFALPAALSEATVRTAQAQVFHSGFPAFGALSTLNPIKVQALSGANRGASPNYTVCIDCWGTL